MSLPLYHLSAERVGVEWVRSVADGVPVGTDLPATDEWSSTGFVTVAAVSSDPDLYSPRRSVVYAVTVWVGSTTSQVVPYAKAADIAERITLAAVGEDGLAGVLEFDADGEFHRVLIGSVWPVSTPRKLEVPDEAGYGRVGFDLGILYGEG